MRIKDIKLLDDGTQQSVAIEIATGEVRTVSAQQLYETTRSLGQGTADPKTAAQRRAEELLALRRKR
ncbi:MAG: hypothetical protein O3B73_08130 [bacterium]|nr:hypothetical protein [bacterium]